MFIYRFRPVDGNPRAIVQIAHGMQDTAARYEHLARCLTDEGCLVVAGDHRGHGRTSRSLDQLGVIGAGGFEWMVRNLNQVNEHIRSEHGRRMPVFLIGHSMGAFLAQRYMELYGESVDGVVLSGSTYFSKPVLQLAVAIAKRECDLRGELAPSKWSHGLTVGRYNRSVKKPQTPFDWLSRDPEQVRKYMDDPFCGTRFPNCFFYELFLGLQATYDIGEMSHIPSGLPILILSGEYDPLGQDALGRKTRGVQQLIRSLSSLGCRNLTSKIYPGGRHEMFNETNRDEVITDMISWMKEILQNK